jgi:hydroxymethylglutaryl-CoA lyase
MDAVTLASHRGRPPHIRFVEVGPRDGLQNEKSSLPVEAKAAFVDALSETGVPEIEAGAFVSAKAVPQMSDSLQVFQRIQRRPGVIYSALVPNERGLDEALRAKADKIAVFTAASETFNRKNTNAGIKESLERFKSVVYRAKSLKMPVRGYISTAYVCPFEGAISPSKVVSLGLSLLDLGVDEIAIGDTIGRAAPKDVRALLKPLLKEISEKRLYFHFHDTYGLAIANILTAYEEFNATGFDASAGGLGGCPFAPGAAGNVATEDAAFALSASGAKVELDFGKLKAAEAVIAPLLGHPFPARLAKAAAHEKANV